MGLLHTESSLGIQVRTSLTIHINHACDNTFIKTSITAISLRPARRRLRSRLVSQWKKKEPLVRRVDINFSGVNFLAADNQVITFTFHQSTVVQGGCVRIHQRCNRSGLFPPWLRSPTRAQVHPWGSQAWILRGPGVLGAVFWFKQLKHQKSICKMNKSVLGAIGPQQWVDCYSSWPGCLYQ